MTRKIRRDKGVPLRGRSVIPGLRMDTELANAVTEYTKWYAREHEVEPNVAAAVRHLLREALSHGGHMDCHGAASCRKEGYFAGIAETRRKLAEASRRA